MGAFLHHQKIPGLGLFFPLVRYDFSGNIDYFNSRSQFDSVYSRFTSSSFIYNGTTDSWFQSLTEWLGSTADTSVLAVINSSTKYPLTEVDFVNLTVQLTTQEQTRHARNILFSQSYGDDIKASKIPYQHTVMATTKDQVEALDGTRQMLTDAGLTALNCFPYSRQYLTWETNKVIQTELYRNLGLACLCVFIVTLILIAHVGTSLMVFSCVLLTLVDVAGSMHFWGLTIDTVTTIVLILAIGLAVDYSAHVGHMFMTVTGTRSERVKETLGEMGPPVFYGGFSTFLAFVLLAGSNSYVFTTFFKVFLLVVLYGLFHGLLFLSVLLSWLGPQPYATADRHYHPSGHPASSSQDVHMDPAVTKESKHTYTNGALSPTADGKSLNGQPAKAWEPKNAPLPLANGRRASANGRTARISPGRVTPPPDYTPPHTPVSGRKGLPPMRK
ncbi:hypothetical protein ACOMHN_049209 [Nucella lapillus]